VIVDRVTELIEHPSTTARDIEAVVETDQALTAKLLCLVNSSFYGFSQRVKTVSRAVGVIGFEALRNLVFTTSVISLFKSEASDTFRPTEFWNHSIGTALAAKEIARRLGERQVEEFFVAGLVHDIGKLVHHEYLTESFLRAGALAAQQDILLLEAEREALHFTHDETGGLLLDHWRLPERLTAMVRYHHTPGRAPEYVREAAAVHLADILCRAKGLGSGGDNKIPLLDRRAWDCLGLAVGDLEHIMARMEQEFGPATAILTE
jgi:putative nucleotidyltransferase with HDIG domain